ncbi:uncharacterized protein LOC132199920 isoform X2 [Neocloeon triangulifer]|uniref:uncharacterized protein LOC132199920 isoform X2 n=1 Tax=Neocloeon triangulifer TaxID=2078957 RepID=UPI00286F8FE7|nr:uncharacterized protein LOC132199920 isoform X2 [Neocloeon triangulifer]
MAESDDRDQELNKLLEIAREKRFNVGNFVRPLKELCVNKIADSDDCAKTNLLPYQYLPLVLKKEILKRMAAQQGSCQVRLTPAMTEWIYKLASCLMNDKTKEFDFSIFGQYDWLDHELDQKVWQMLAERCPNLETISDKWQKQKRGGDSFYMSNVMPHLEKFQHLKHILLKRFVSNSDDLEQIAQHFPNLVSLSTTFEFVDTQLMKNLFLLQNLKQLDINWNIWNNQDRSVLDEQTNYWRQFKVECMEHLPCLQYCYMSVGACYINGIRPYRGNSQQLSLREMAVVSDIDFELFPSLETLTVLGPLKSKSHEFGVLSNLTVLELIEVDTSDVPVVLTHCGNKLHELTIIAFGPQYLDPYKVIVKCPNLRKFDVSADFFDNQSTFFKSQVNTNHMRYMKHFKIWTYAYEDMNFPSDFLTLALAAPDLETFKSYSLNISLTKLTLLTEQLVAGCILQNLKKFKFECSEHEPSTCFELLKFICLLPVHAPRLQLIQSKCFSNEFEEQFKKSFLFDMIDQIDGLKIAIELPD